MIKFIKIKYRNILTSGNNPIELDLSKGNIAIMGANGSGKSNMIDCIHYALYGKAFRSGKSKSSLINNTNKSNLLVELELLANGKVLKIKRGMTPSVFSIEYDGKEIDNKTSLNGTQKVLDGIIKLESHLFSSIVCLSKTKIRDFLILKATDRRKLLDEICNISFITELNESYKDDKKELESKQHVIDLELSKLTTKIETIDSYNKSLVTNNNQLNAKTAQLADLIDAKEKVTQAIALIDIDALNADLSALNDTSNKIIEVNNKKTEYRSKILADRQKQERLIKENKNINNSIEKTRANICDLCTQTINEEQVKRVLIDYNNKIEYNKKLIKENNDDIEKNEHTVKYKIDIALEKLSARLANKQTLEQSKNKYNELIAKQNVLLNRITDTEESISSLKKQPKPKCTNELNKERDIILKDCAELQKETGDVSTLVKMTSDKGIKNFIIKKYMSSFNDVLNKYLNEFNIGFKIEINGDFKETVTSNRNLELEYEMLSEGEKLRVNLCMLLSFRYISTISNGIHSDLILLDEVLDSSLDETGVNDFLNILKKEDIRYLIITHSMDRLQDDVNKIKVIKRDGFTSYSEI